MQHQVSIAPLTNLGRRNLAETAYRTKDVMRAYTEEKKRERNIKLAQPAISMLVASLVVV
jgi:adenine-specific DNA methylase